MEILIPFKRPGLLTALMGLMYQHEVNFSVILRDDGFHSEFDEMNETIITALSKKVPVKILRTTKGNVLQARRELFEASMDEIVVYLDSDIFLMPHALYHLLYAMQKNPEYTFYQGAKLEVNANRKYQNEINELGSQLNNMSEEEVLELRSITTYFGDTALVAYWRIHLENIWNKIQVDDIGLGGTDALMSAMACSENKNHCGVAIPQIIGYHYEKNIFKRNWEMGADRYVYDKLKGLNISEDIYNGIYKHLR